MRIYSRPRWRGLASMLAGLVLLTYVGEVAPVCAQPLQVRHIQPEADGDTRSAYFIQLLDLVLSKTDGPYTLAPSATRMQQGRALAQLEKGEDVDVVWTMTSAEREQTLQPIRIPLSKGLIGTRLLLIRRADADRFAQASTDLRSLRAGQGHDWPDTAILRHNGFPVVGSSSYEALFQMLNRQRFDYFPRSLVEIWGELDTFPTLDLMVEPTLVLQYPAATYFFVNPENHALAERLETGLHRALADGSFDQLFNQHFGEMLTRARLQERHRITLENPLLPPLTPLAQAALWHQY